MSKMMVARYKHGMAWDFERAINFLGGVFPRIYPTQKIGRFKNGDRNADSDPDDNKMEGRPVNISGMDLKNFILD